MTLRDQLLTSGYIANVAPAGAFQIDAQVCAESACGRCGHRGLIFEPYVRLSPPPMRERVSYRVIARCPVCREELEV
jgi:hypothetical protein